MLFKVLLAVELPLTIAVLTIFGIASPNLYRTRLWQDGADNGFNSSPDEMVYAFANYRSYSTPKPWSQFITSFNLVITVLSMFWLLVKTPMFVMNVFYPPLSIIVHIAMLTIYLVSAIYQAGSDMTDKDHPQSGPPWYITKNCNVAKRSNNVGYCKQAKAGFACTIILLVIFTTHIVLAIISCLPNDETRERQQEKRDRIATLEELKSLKSPVYPNFVMTDMGKQPITPRTMTFNQLGGTNDLPLRAHQEQQTPNMMMDLEAGVAQPEPAMYFPPPPKKASK